MKKIIINIILCLFFSNLFSQNKENISVERSIYGIQIGLLGGWINNESKLTDNISIRSEIGLDFGYLGGEFNKGTNLIFYPSITIEPRYYYNLNKRSNNSKNIKNNSANFIALSADYHPDWFVLNSNKKNNIYINNQISLVPKWGIKRTKNNVTFEAGIGYGVNYILDNEYIGNKSFGILDLHLRIGYTF